MTPNDIEVLIHHHVSPSRHPRYDAPAVRETIDNFVKNDIFYTYNGKDEYRTTEKGKVLMHILCSTPFPEVRWVGKDGEIIDIDETNP